MVEATQLLPLVMPSPRTLRAPAVWITTRSWAVAAAQRFGNARVVTPDGSWEADQLGQLIDGMLATSPPPGRQRHPVTVAFRTLVKDVRLAGRHVQGSRQRPGVGPHAPAFVWQHHDPFLTLGSRLARSVDAPLVQFVDAPHVWEARRWGVARPGWGSLLERLGEVPQLRRADLIVCVSDEVAEAVDTLTGGAPECIVTPCTADATFFAMSTDRDAIRTRLGASDTDVMIGWSGSFRRFHAVDQLIEAFGAVAPDRPDLRLLLVGDGPDRGRLAEIAAATTVSDRITFTGQVPYSRMRDHVAAMDIAVLTARDGGAFHYSPLKLREYRAAARAVIAPAAGQIVDAVTDEVDGLLYEAGDVTTLSRHIAALADDVTSRRRFGEAARSDEVSRGGASAQIDAVLTHLGRDRRRFDQPEEG